MHLQKLLQRLRTVDHQVHSWTLIIVVVGAATQAAAYLLPKFAPGARIPSAVTDFLATALHALHWVAVGALVLYASFYYFFTRKPSVDLAKQLPEPSASGGSPINSQENGSIQVPYTYKGRGVSADDVQFVGRADTALAEITHQMNHDGFQRSHFELTLNEVRARNSELIAHNQSTFLLLRDPNRESTTVAEKSTRSDFIGYTCVLPLNEVGTEIYLRGLISDKQFPGCLLARDREAASSLLLFAMYLEQQFRVGTAGSRYVHFLVRCVEHHIRELARTQTPQSGSIDVWAQAEDERLRHHLINRGFVKTEKMSKEGFPLYKRTLAKNVAAQS